MAKKVGGDFIERENQTTVWAIISIVVIVAVVAIFLRVQNIDIFSLSDHSFGGLATNTFEGVHYLPLERHEMLQGRVDIQGMPALSFYAFLPDNILSVNMGERSYETQLEKEIEGIYSASFPFEDRTVKVVLNTATYQLWLSGAISFDPKMVLSAPVVPAVLYDGSLIVTGSEISAQYIPGSEALALTVDREQFFVPLVDNENQIEGVWNWKGANHPVIVDLGKEIIIFREMY